MGAETNLFGYCLGNPVNLTDVLGLCVHCYYIVHLHQLVCLGDGEMFNTDKAWSGRGQCRDDSGHEREESCGPIPRGVWRMGCPGCTAPHDTPRIPLKACPGTERYGRGPFQIHPGRGQGASEGCIVMPPDVNNEFLHFYRSQGGCGRVYVGT
jgi:hypothetical protein